MRYALLFIMLLLYGCNTYHVSTESLVHQMAKVKKDNRTGNMPVPVILSFNPATLIVGAALTVPFLYMASTAPHITTLRRITVLDKKGREHTLPVTNRTGIKITQKSGKHTTFYLNTMQVNDSTITGQKTLYFKSSIRPIPIANISKIEVQK